MPPKFYAVARGRAVGIYNSWAEAQPLVNGFVGARYKSFLNRDEASAFIQAESSSLPSAPQQYMHALPQQQQQLVSAPPMMTAPAMHTLVPAYNFAAPAQGTVMPAVGAGPIAASAGAKAKFYAVARGRAVGIFSSWAEAQPLVSGYIGARYKSFSSREEAAAFIQAESMGAMLAAAAAAAAASPHQPPPCSLQPSVPSAPTACPPICTSSAWGVAGTVPYSSGAYYQGTAASSPNNSGTAATAAKAPMNTTMALLSGAGGLPSSSRPTINIGAASPSRPWDLPPPLVAYTDGACPNNGSASVGLAKAGFGVHWPPRENYGPFLPLPEDISKAVPPSMKQTNNVGELMAVNAAVRAIVERDRGDDDGHRRQLGAGEGAVAAKRRRTEAAVYNCDDSTSDDGDGEDSADPSPSSSSLLLSRRRTQPLLVHADSKYCIDGATKWLEGWSAKGWRLKGGASSSSSSSTSANIYDEASGGIKNLALWQELDALMRERREQMRLGLLAVYGSGGSGGGSSSRVPVGQKAGRSRASPGPYPEGDAALDAMDVYGNPLPSASSSSSSSLVRDMGSAEASRIAAQFAIVFNHVRGHQGVAGNEMADRLAVMGAMGMGR